MEEEQNKLEKLGISYMYEAKNTNNEKKAREALSKAESAFKKSLSLCDQLLIGKQNVRNLLNKKAALLLNCGVIKQWSGEMNALKNITQATEICKEHQLDEMLLNCYLVEALYYTNTKEIANNTNIALSLLDKALNLAAMLPNMDERKCQLMYYKAKVYCKQSNYESASQILKRAKKINCSDDELNKAIKRKLASVSDMCENEAIHSNAKLSDHDAMKEVSIKLGDRASKLQCYRDAINHYRRALESGKIIQKRTKQDEKPLAPIYSGMFTCHKALEEYAEAIQNKRDEYELIKDDQLKAFNALYAILKIQCKIKKQYHIFYKDASEAIKIAEEIRDDRRHIKILKLILMYQKHCGRTKEIVETKNKLRAFGFSNFDDLEDSSDDEQSPTKDIIITRLARLSEYTDAPSSSTQDAQRTLNNTGTPSKQVSNNGSKATSDKENNGQSDLSNSDDEETPSLLRRRSSEYIIRRNQYGESKLQEACKKGHKDKVLQLLSEGHPIDVTDHAGWTPLHEACEIGHKEIAQILINKGADINNAVNRDRITPLHKAAGRGNLEVMELLLDSNASVSLKTRKNETALELLTEWRNSVILTNDEAVLCNRVENKLKKLIKGKTPLKQKTNPNTPVKDGDSHQQINKEVNRNIFGKDVSNSVRVTTRRATLSSIEVVNPVTNRTLRNGRLLSTDATDKRAKSRETDINNKKNNNDVSQSKTKGNKRKSTEESEKSPNAMENTPKKARPEEKNSKKVCPAKKTPKKITTPKKSTISANNSQIKTPKYMRVKVQVEGESFWIPVDMDTINDFNMSWLVREAQFRYFKETNNLVELTLMAEGAKIFENDPLSMVLNFTEINSLIKKRHNVEDDDDFTTVDAPVDVEPIPSTSTMEPNRTIPEKKYTKDDITQIFLNALNNTNVDDNFHKFCEQVKYIIDVYLK